MCEQNFIKNEVSILKSLIQEAIKESLSEEVLLLTRAIENLSDRIDVLTERHEELLEIVKKNLGDSDFYFKNQSEEKFDKKEVKLPCFKGEIPIENSTIMNRRHSSSSSSDEEKDYKKSSTPKCSTCNKQIEGKILNALGKSFHPEHFVCTKCKKPITDEKFQAHEGEPYCADDYAKMFLSKCHSCQKPIKERVIKALGHDWHPEHFVCTICKTSLVGSSFMERDGKPLCQVCFESNYADKCKECGKAIGEKTIIALDAKWHPDCFKCLKCKKPITEDSFQVESGKPICMKCT